MGQYLTVEQTAQMLGITKATLANWRLKGQNLQYLKPSGKCILYREADVMAYIESTINPVSQDKCGRARNA